MLFPAMFQMMIEVAVVVAVVVFHVEYSGNTDVTRGRNLKNGSERNLRTLRELLILLSNRLVCL